MDPAVHPPAAQPAERGGRSKRILMLTQVLPYPADSGPKVKTLNVLKHLSRRHQIVLASFVRGDQSSDVQALESYCEQVVTVPIRRHPISDIVHLIRSLLTRQPFLMIRDDRKEMRRRIEQLDQTHSFDVVHVDQLNMAQYAAYVRQPAVRVLDAHNALWKLYRRLWQTLRPGARKWVLGREWKLLRSYEGAVCRSFDAVLAVSEEDREALEAAAGESLPIRIIPIAVDTEETARIPFRSGAHHLLHMGTMFWPPNAEGVLWFLEEIWPRIRSRHPDVVFDIVGADPPAVIRAYEKNGSRVRVPGYVADPAPYLERAAVMVVPLLAGGGMRVKILNALAQGLPIVSTGIGCEGIAVEPGRHLLVADTPEAFAEAVSRLLEDRALARRLGDQGRRLAESTYDYRVVCRELDSMYETLRERAAA